MSLLPGNYAPLIEEFAAERALSMKGSSPQSLISDAMHKFPNALAIEAAFAFVSLASALERPILESDKADARFSQGLYRAISILTADIYAVETLKGPSPRCKHVTKFWVESGEAFFLGHQGTV